MSLRLRHRDNDDKEAWEAYWEWWDKEHLKKKKVKDNEDKD